MNNQLRNHLEANQLPESVINEVTEMFASEAGRVLSLLEKYDSKTQEVVTAAIHKYYVSMGLNTSVYSDRVLSVTNHGILGNIRPEMTDAANDRVLSVTNHGILGNIRPEMTDAANEGVSHDAREAA